MDATPPSNAKHVIVSELDISEAIAGKILHSSESAILGVNIRAILALVMVITICALALLSRPIPAELVTLTAAAVTFYFAQKSEKSENKNPKTP